MTKVMKEELSKKFKEEILAGFPIFSIYKKKMDRVLWILWVSKDEFGIKCLTAEDIVYTLLHGKEISLSKKSVVQSLHKAGEKIHVYHDDQETYYEIMQPGKDYLKTQIKGSLEIFYFEPDKGYTHKKTLAMDILKNLKGELKIVDPYCGERTLDILTASGSKNVKFLTKTAKLDERDKRKFLRELKDFKPENPSIEFREYPANDIHDRYIISSDKFVILGHSIKNLGGKESFAIILDKESYINIFESLTENFDTRWSVSNPI